MEAKVAVVILNWNGAEMLRRFLPSVVCNSAGVGIDVYVADNASTDNSLSRYITAFLGAAMRER